MLATLIKTRTGQPFEDGRMTLASAASRAEDVLFRVGGKVDLGKLGSYLGTYLAPYGELKLGEGARLEGALYGHKVKLEKESQIIGWPALEVFMALHVTP